MSRVCRTQYETKIKQFTQLDCIVDNIKLIDFEKGHSWLSARKRELEAQPNCKVVFLCVAHRVLKQHMQTFDRRPSLLLYRTLLNAMWLCGPSLNEIYHEKKHRGNTELDAFDVLFYSNWNLFCHLPLSPVLAPFKYLRCVSISKQQKFIAVVSFISTSLLLQ